VCDFKGVKLRRRIGQETNLFSGKRRI